jgi:hypothetical protein
VRRFLLASVCAATLLLGTAEGALADDGVEHACPNPCPGYRYVLAYRLSDGFIRVGVGWDPRGPLGSDPMDVVDLREGEALLDFTGDARIADIFKNPDDYVVNVLTRELTKKSGLPIGTATPLGMVLGGAIGGPAGAVAGYGAIRRFRRRRRLNSGAG